MKNYYYVQAMVLVVAIVGVVGLTQVSTGNNSQSAAAVGVLGVPPAGVQFLSPVSTPSEFVASKTGAIDAVKFSYSFTAGADPITIRDLEFTDSAGSSGATAIRVGATTTFSFASGTAYMSGLSIKVAKGTSKSVDLYVSYPITGSITVPSQTVSNVSLSALAYVNNTTGKIGTMNSLNLATIPEMLVGSKPIVSVYNPTTVIKTGKNTVIDVTISADPQGDIIVNNLPIVLSVKNVTLAGGKSTIIVNDSAGVLLPTTNTTITGVGGSTVINFLGGYKIAAGTTKTFHISVPVTKFIPSPAKAPKQAWIKTNIGASNNFGWTDKAGASTKLITGKINTNFFYNYPSIVAVIYG